MTTATPALTHLDVGWDDQRLASAALNAVTERDDPAHINRFLPDVLDCCAADAWEGLLNEDSDTGRRARELNLEAIVDQADKIGARFITPTDDEWPRTLDMDTQWAPYGLWVMGNGHLDTLTRHAVAITGRKAAWSTSCTLAASWATQLADPNGKGAPGRVVMASTLGSLDAEVLSAADAPGGVCVAVANSGLAFTYSETRDPQPKDLMDSIASRGMVVSARPLTSTNTRTAAIISPNLLASLAPDLVIVDALRHSRLIEAADTAVQAGHNVYAVPMNTISTDPTYGEIPDDGTITQLITAGLAQPVTTIDELNTYLKS